MCIRVRSLRKFGKFIYIFFIIVTGRKCCCASIHGYDHGKTWESPFELNIFSFKPSAKKCVSWVYTSPTSVLSSAEVGFFSCKFRRHFFSPYNWRRFVFSSLYFGVSWLTSLMLLVYDGYLLAVATSPHKHASWISSSVCAPCLHPCAYITSIFFPSPSCIDSLACVQCRIRRVPCKPLESIGHASDDDGGTWWPSCVLQVTTRQVRNFWNRRAMNSWLLDKIHIDREPLARSSNYYIVRLTRRDILRTKFQVRVC